MHGALTGHRANSTRTELAAGILALLAPGPIHQGTDSKAYKDKAHRILQGQQLNRKKPWNLQKDGVLWEWFDILSRAKGRHSIRITKVKGHVTEEMVKEGKVKADHNKGNDTADTLATEGTKQHGDAAMELAAFYAVRQKQYQLFMLDVHTLIKREIAGKKT